MPEYEDLKPLLSAYHDGEVTPEEKRFIQERMACDPALKQYYNQMRKLSSTLKTWGDEELSPDLEQKVNNNLYRLHPREVTKPKDNMMITVAKVGTGVLAGFLIAIVVSRYLSDDKGFLRVDYAQRVEKEKNNGDAVLFDKATKPIQLSRQAPQDFINPALIRKRLINDLQKIPEEKSFPTVTEMPLISKIFPVTPAIPVQYASETIPLIGSMDRLARARDFTHLFADEFSPQSSGHLSYVSDNISPFKQNDYVPVSFETEPLEEGFTQYDTAPMTEEYNRIYENEFLNAKDKPLSTFSIDVDTASYANIRRYLKTNQLPPPDAVRINEMINYFNYQYPHPVPDVPFSVTLEASQCPWNKAHELILIGLQGKALTEKEIPSSNLVFAIDVSGSMQKPDKLPLLKQTLKNMIKQLGKKEHVAIVVYAGRAGIVLDSTPGSEQQKISDAIDLLQAGGSTAGATGIELAYQIAQNNFIPGGNNRVVLATDGDFNIGLSSTGALARLIEKKRQQDIFLTVLGLGTGNFKDARLAQLAKQGNGNYYYLDSLKEGKKVLVHELGSTLFTVANDVKVQIEFNPSQVKAYRLIGYENRILGRKNFNRDGNDAGELGAGHNVTALYEVVLNDSPESESFTQADSLVYQQNHTVSSGDLMTVKLRYKNPGQAESKLISEKIRRDEILVEPKNDFRFAAAVTEAGLILGDSQFKADANWDDVLQRSQKSIGEDPYGYRQEFVSLMETARNLDSAIEKPVFIKDVEQDTPKSRIFFKGY